MADLDGLKSLYAWMRQEDVLYAKCDGLELRLTPKPITLDEVVPEDVAHARAPANLDAEERDALDELLLSGDDSAYDAILALNKRVA